MALSFTEAPVVGGLVRVFELNRNFRNEGSAFGTTPRSPCWSSTRPTPPMKTSTPCRDHVRQGGHGREGSLKFEYQGQPKDLTPPWQSIDFRSSLLEREGAPRGAL